MASVAGEGRVSYLGDHQEAGLRGPNAMAGLRGQNAMAALPTATELTLSEAWPGVDGAWSGTGGRIEATYQLAPGADPSQVEVAWRGAEAVDVTDEGRLSVANEQDC
jgi:hypothetical protein